VIFWLTNGAKSSIYERHAVISAPVCDRRQNPSVKEEHSDGWQCRPAAPAETVGIRLCPGLGGLLQLSVR